MVFIIYRYPSLWLVSVQSKPDKIEPATNANEIQVFGFIILSIYFEGFNVSSQQPLHACFSFTINILINKHAWMNNMYYYYYSIKKKYCKWMKYERKNNRINSMEFHCAHDSVIIDVTKLNFQTSKSIRVFVCFLLFRNFREAGDQHIRSTAIFLLFFFLLLLLAAASLHTI